VASAEVSAAYAVVIVPAAMVSAQTIAQIDLSLRFIRDLLRFFLPRQFCMPLIAQNHTTAVTASQ
jgi:hypothetical protein